MTQEVTTMRILLAIDGSRSADRAVSLVAALPWPAGSRIRVVGVFDGHAPVFETFIRTAPDGLSDPEAQKGYTLDTALDDAVRDLSAADRTVERFLLRGRPASAITEEARDFEPELIVLGSRGHGRLESMLLGSVSAEVVDHAPCPVLVVREPEVRSLLFAEDASTSAWNAGETLTAWPVFTGFPVDVVTVAETAIPMSPGMAAGLYDEVVASYAESVDDARREAHAIAAQTAQRLAAAGYRSHAVVREGDPAHEIVALAKEAGHGLIVIGTRGHAGLARLLLGSVARNVLLHAPCSVLVVREKAVVRHEAGDRGREPATAAH